MKFNIHQSNHEIKNHFQIRKKFIQFCNPKNKNELFYYENLSHIFINISFLRCRYNKKTEIIIFEIVKNMKNNNLLKLLPKNYSSLKVSELKNILKKKKLSTVGKKNELIKRLENS